MFAYFRLGCLQFGSGHARQSINASVIFLDIQQKNYLRFDSLDEYELGDAARKQENCNFQVLLKKN